MSTAVSGWQRARFRQVPNTFPFQYGPSKREPGWFQGLLSSSFARLLEADLQFLLVHSLSQSSVPLLARVWCEEKLPVHYGRRTSLERLFFKCIIKAFRSFERLSFEGMFSPVTVDVAVCTIRLVPKRRSPGYQELRASSALQC